MYPLGFTSIAMENLNFICIKWNKAGERGVLAIHIAKRTSNFKSKLKHNFHSFSIIWKEGLLWSWLYGGWMYNYLCNQCLSPLNLWVWILLMARCTRTTLYSLSVTCDRLVVFSGYSSFAHQKNWPPQYNWNIVESGIKHHNPNPNRRRFIKKFIYITYWDMQIM